jgi:hypothetical protein
LIPIVCSIVSSFVSFKVENVKSTDIKNVVGKESEIIEGSKDRSSFITIIKSGFLVNIGFMI